MLISLMFILFRLELLKCREKDGFITACRLCPAWRSLESFGEPRRKGDFWLMALLRMAGKAEKRIRALTDHSDRTVAAENIIDSW